MRFYSEHRAFTCGVELHGGTLVLFALDRAGGVVLRRNLPCKKQSVLGVRAPLRDDLVAGCDRVVCWQPSDRPTLPLT